MIKVLHYGLSENRGGIETYLYKISTNINKKKYQFRFIDMNIGEAAFKSELKELGCIFHKITPRKVSIRKNRQELEKLFEIEKFDIFHFHINTLSYILPIQIALKNGCKVIIHSRNAGAAHQIHTKVLHYLHYLILPRKKIKMLAVSDKAGRWLFGKNANFRVINNGIAIKEYRFDKGIRTVVRNKLGIEKNLVLGVVGTFLPAKNHKFVIDIFSELQKINDNTCLLLIGDGPLKRACVQMCKGKHLKNVLFLGNRPDVNILYNAMDILLMPSLFEGFPNVCLEAQTNGLPCIVSDVITKEIDVTGVKYISLQDTPKQWAEIINNIKVNNYEYRLSAADNICSNGFSVTDEMKKLENIYYELMQM